MNFVSAGLQELARASRLFVAVAVSQVADSRLVAATAYAYYRVVTGDLAEGMLAHPWSAGISYDVCRAGVASNNTVAITASGQVFACIMSPGTATTEEPVTQLAPEVFTADGYGWRYLYTVSQAYREKFAWNEGTVIRPMAPLYTSTFETDGLPLTPIVGTPVCYLDPARPDVVPYAVKNVSDVVVAVMLPAGAVIKPVELYACIQDPTATGSGATAAVTVNQNGTVTIAPAIEGTGYAAARVTIVGDGEGASFTANVAGGGVVGYTTLSAGSGYTKARAIVTAGANSAVVAAVLPSVNDDFTRSHTLLSKPLSASSGPTDLTAFLVVTDEPFASSRASGPLGDSSIVEMTGEPLVIARISTPGEFSMTENIQINTAVRTG